MAGAGKTSWIHSLDCYTKYSNFENAVNSAKFLPLVCQATGSSSTADVFETLLHTANLSPSGIYQCFGPLKTNSVEIYDLHFEGTNFRFIDTPGIHVAVDSIQVATQWESILDEISDIHYLNGICLVMKPNVSKLAVLVFLTNLLHIITFKATRTLFLCFTHVREFGRSNHFCEIMETCQEYFGSTGISVNIFCFDSESFHYFLSKVSTSVKVLTDSPNENSFAKIMSSWGHWHSESVKFLQSASSMRNYSVSKLQTIYFATRVIHVLQEFENIFLSKRTFPTGEKLELQKMLADLANYRVGTSYLNNPMELSVDTSTFEKDHDLESDTQQDYCKLMRSWKCLCNEWNILANLMGRIGLYGSIQRIRDEEKPKKYTIDEISILLMNLIQRASYGKDLLEFLRRGNY
jgi:hypothetical protein